MPYRIAGIDVHKKMLAVVVADVGSDGEYHFERQRVGTSGSASSSLRSPQFSWAGGGRVGAR